MPDLTRPLENQPKTIGGITEECIASLRMALQQTEELAKERHAQKLSNSRICSVSREIKELLKVMTRYCQC